VVRFAPPTLRGRQGRRHRRFDAAGLRVGAGVLCDACGGEPADEPRPTTVLAAGTGSARVRVGASATRFGDPCIAFATAGERMDDCTEFQLGGGTAVARVSCAPRRTIVYGMTHHRPGATGWRGRRVIARLAAFLPVPCQGDSRSSRLPRTPRSPVVRRA
jgi:hypothetical protein